MLDASLPNVGVAQVLESANHPMSPCDGAEAASLPLNSRRTRHTAAESRTRRVCCRTTTATCWALHPEALTYWYSQGLVWSMSEAPGRTHLLRPFADTVAGPLLAPTAATLADPTGGASSPVSTCTIRQHLHGTA